MSILVNKDTRVLCQGLTGAQGSLHCEQMIAYGTQIVGGVTPGKGGSEHLGVPVFDTVRDAVKVTNASCSIIFVPAPFCKDAIIEAVYAGIKVIVCITEGIPVHDMLIVKAVVDHHRVRLIGPNCPGIITPGACKVGIMPGAIHQAGSVGIVSRSGTLTYEAVHQTTQSGHGQSSVIGIGGDPVVGSSFIDILSLFEQDEQTKAVILVGEIGGGAEESAAEWAVDHFTKPIIAYIAGMTAPEGKRMGHAGAIISGSSGTAAGKFAALQAAGVHTVSKPTDLGACVVKVLSAKS